MRNRRLAILLLVLAVWLCSAPANLLAAAADNALHDFARAIIDSDDPPPAGWQACSNFCFSPASPAMRTDGETRVMWVRAHFTRNGTDKAPLAWDAAFSSERLRVWINGHPIFRNDLGPAPPRFATETPVMAVIPVGALRQGDNKLLVRVEARSRWQFGIGHMAVGPAAPIALAWQRLMLVNHDVPEALNDVIATLAAIILLVGLNRRQEPEFLWLALAGGAWWVHGLRAYLTNPPLPVWSMWDILHNSIYFVVIGYSAFTAYFFDIAGKRRWAISAVATGLTCVALRYVFIDFGLDDVFSDILLAVFALAILFAIIREGICRRRMKNFAMLAVSAIAVASGIYDLGLDQNVWNDQSFVMMPYAGLAVFAIFTGLLGQRMLAAMSAVEQLNSVLEARVAVATEELRRVEQARQALELANALEQERERMMREIHDGIGSNLVTALAVAERQAQPATTIATLRRSITDLKLAVDSLEPVENDVTALLASFRHRLAPDLQRAGVACVWQVEACPPVAWLEATSALHVLRLMQEAVGNVLAHAGARSITFRARSADHAGAAGVLVEIIDDGAGFRTDKGSSGRGLANMAARANAIGARFACQSHSGAGTTVSLFLPLEQFQRAFQGSG